MFSKVCEANKGKRDVAKALEEQDKQLTGTRELLTKLIYQGNLQLESLRDPLASVKDTVEDLKKLLAGDKPERLDTTKIANAVGDVEEATSNLKGQIPGNTFTATRIHTGRNALNLQGIVSETPIKLNGRVSVDVKDSVAEEGSVTVGTLFTGSLAALGAMHENALRHAGLQKGEKGEVGNAKSGK